MVHTIERSVDALLGADETAVRVRRYVAEHDSPADNTIAFGRLCEVIFAQGIGFRVVFAKREALQEAFLGFDPQKVAAFDSSDVRRLLSKPIIRNETKIRACIENSRRWCELSEGGNYLARVARAAADDDPATGWPALVAMLAADYSRINETGARQTLKRWGFFTAFAHPGARRLVQRLGFVTTEAHDAAGQLYIGALAQALSRDPYALEAVLSLFAALGPCRPEPRCAQCGVAERCPTGAKKRNAA